MSYEVLARRWRPQTFDDVVGQSHVTITLANALRSERLSHAILLAGPRGVGKTSIARILARSLNCDEGPTEKPCGRCSPCVEIANSTSLDVQEIDAASHTGVDNVRELRDSIRYAAAPGKHRIFIIDEVHMLSQAAFNALLKTLEEPPPRSLFIFATTDPQKIPVTVLSRVQRFDLKRLGGSELLSRLRQIVASEAIEIPESVLRAIIREVDGSLRDALTLLDRLVSGFGSSVSEEAAAAVLDLVDRRILLDVLDPVLERDPANALSALRRALEKGVAPTRLAADLLEEVRNHVVACIVKDPGELVQLAEEEVAEVQERARKHDVETFQRLFRVLLSRTQELGFAPRPAHALEMAVVRLATLPSSESLSALITRLEALENGGAPGPGGGGSTRGEGSGTRPRPPGTGGAPGQRAGSPPRREVPRARAPASTPPPRRDLDQEARLRNEAKSHPLVREIIEVLDAEICEIRTHSSLQPAPALDEDPG
jgi:DNA polymerase-3 subunit gamma/tau